MKNRPVYGRIPVDYTPMQDLSIDIKTMPQFFGGYHLLLVITYDQTNFTIAVPLRDRTAQTVSISQGPTRSDKSLIPQDKHNTG